MLNDAEMLKTEEDIYVYIYMYGDIWRIQFVWGVLMSEVSTLSCMDQPAQPAQKMNLLAFEHP
jgi:hypothetical protein